MGERFIHIQGFEELDQKLKELPAKIEAKLLRGACRASAKVLRDEVQNRVPHGATGALADSIRVSTSIKASQGLVTAKVVAGSSKAFYAAMVEKGTKPHVISAKRAKRLMLGATGIFPVSVQHPGAKPKPFMAPALEAKADDAVEAAAQYLRDHLDEALT